MIAIIIGYFALGVSGVLLVIPCLPPKDDPETTVRIWKLSALFLIAAAISFHG